MPSGAGASALAWTNASEASAKKLEGGKEGSLAASRNMKTMIGKVNDDFFCQSILPFTGADSAQVLVGPTMGVDAAVLKLGEQYLAIAEDPIFPSPASTPEDFGWFTVHIGASDVAVLGIRPRFMTYSLLMPPGTAEDYIRRLVQSISDTARDLGITIVGGHTGFYPSVVTPTIGGITVWGTGSEFVLPSGAQVGDAVIVTKGAAIEASGILASELGKRMRRDGIAPELIEKASQRCFQMSVVKDAAVAMQVGGVHAMHDATEGGVARGLWEVAEASGVGLRIQRDQILVPEDIRVTCNYFGLDPYISISEGTMVMTCDADKAEAMLRAFQAAGIEASVVGKVVPKDEGRVWVTAGGEEPLVAPPEDPFWEVFFAAMTDGNQPTEETPQAQLIAELKAAIERMKAANIAPLLPEIGANCAYALPEARDLDDIVGIPGRMLRFRGQVATLGEPEMGASRRMGSTILTVREYFPEARCVANFASTPAVRQACLDLGFRVAAVPGPADCIQPEEEFDGELRRLLAQQDGLPDIIDTPDRVNLERVILVLGRNPQEVADKAIAITRKIQGN